MTKEALGLIIQTYKLKSNLLSIIPTTVNLYVYDYFIGEYFNGLLKPYQKHTND